MLDFVRVSAILPPKIYEQSHKRLEWYICCYSKWSEWLNKPFKMTNKRKTRAKGNEHFKTLGARHINPGFLEVNSSLSAPFSTSQRRGVFSVVSDASLPQDGQRIFDQCRVEIALGAPMTVNGQTTRA